MNILHLIISRQFTKTTQYHDATNSTHCLFVSWYFPSMSQKRLGTKTLRIPRVISIFCGNSHENHQKGSVPWCHKCQIFSKFFKVFHMKFIKTVQYHDATNDMLYLNFVSWYFPGNSPKQLSTRMLQIARIVYLSHDIFHRCHRNGSVPRRYGYHVLSHFFCGISHENHQNGSVPWCHR